MGQWTGHFSGIQMAQLIVQRTVQPMVHRSERLTSQATEHGMARQTVQKMGLRSVRRLEMQMALQLVQQMA